MGKVFSPALYSIKDVLSPPTSHFFEEDLYGGSQDQGLQVRLVLIFTKLLIICRHGNSWKLT
jgi:hypothetical protein